MDPPLSFFFLSLSLHMHLHVYVSFEYDVSFYTTVPQFYFIIDSNTWYKVKLTAFCFPQVIEHATFNPCNHGIKYQINEMKDSTPARKAD